MARTPRLSERQRQEAAVERILAQAQPAIAQAFREAIADARGLVDINELIAALDAAIATGAFGPVIELLTIPQASLFPLEEAIRAPFIAAAQAVDMPSGIAGRFNFNGQDARAIANVRRQALELSGVIIREQTDAVRAVLVDAVENGRGARKTALEIMGRISRATGQRTGGIIGLTGQQTEWAVSARQELQALDGKYLKRALRDKRYDKLVKRSIKDGKPLSVADVDRITMRYKDRLLDYRGTTIARDQAQTAQATGRREAYAQMDERDDIERVEKTWITGYSREPRDAHKLVTGTTIPLDQKFDVGGVPMDRPHDPDVSLDERIGCRCTLFYRAIPKRGQR